MPWRAPLLTVAQVLAWADAHHRRTGKWPQANSGRVPYAPWPVTWRAIDRALNQGRRGLPRGLSVARLLAAERGKRNKSQLPRLTVARILAWADRHYQRTGSWPTVSSGPVLDAPGETWRNLNSALAEGCRGLPGGETLARILNRDRAWARSG